MGMFSICAMTLPGVAAKAFRQARDTFTEENVRGLIFVRLEPNH